MKNIVKTILGIVFSSLFFLVFTGNAHAESASKLMPDSNHVILTDKANILNKTTGNLVTKQEDAFSKMVKHPQVAVVTIKSSNGEDLNDYIEKMTDNGYWSVGQKGEDNGVIILFAKNGGSNNVYIATGKQAEVYLTDSQTQDILQKNKKLLKSSNNSDVNKGIQNTFKSVVDNTNKFYNLTPSEQKKQVKEYNKRETRTVIFVIILIIILVSVFAFLGIGGVFIGGDFGGSDVLTACIAWDDCGISRRAAASICLSCCRIRP